MNKSIYIAFFILIIPHLLFSQKLELKKLYVFNKINNGEIVTIIDSLDKLINEDPSKELQLAKIEVLIKLERYSDALELAEKINKTNNGVASEQKLRIYLEQDNYVNVEQALINNLKSNSKISLFNLLNNPDYNKLIGSELLDSILNSNLYSKTEKQLYQVERLLDLERYDQALFMVDEIINRNSKVAHVYYLKSLINSKDGNENRAIATINIAIDLKSSNPDYYCHRVNILTKQKKYKQALIDVERLTLLQSYEFKHFERKAELLMLTNEFVKAIDLTEQLLKVDSKNVKLLYILAYSNHTVGKNIDALKAVNELMQINTSKQGFELRGDIYMDTGTFEFAVRDYSMFLDIEPYNGDIYAKKGLARHKLGDGKGACSDWVKAKRYGSYNAIRYLEKYCE